MTIITYDAVNDIIKAIKDEWQARDIGPIPMLTPIWEAKTVGYGDSRRDNIIVEPLQEDIEPFDLYGKAYKHEMEIKLDIRTYASIDRHNRVVKEVSRITKNIIRRASEGFIDVVIRGSESFNKDYRNMYRHTITLNYRDVNSHTFV